MGSSRFYSLPSYKEKQSRLAREAWIKRRSHFEYKLEERACDRSACKRKFKVSPSDPKRYCSRNCSATQNNSLRGGHSLETKRKIAQKLLGRPSPYKGVIKVPRVEVQCANPVCGRTFPTVHWRKAKYCSNTCLMKVVGGKPTSPRASRGKAGIRKDISPSIYFYSRWEANMARLYTFLGVVWEYSPRAFDIGGQNYTPDFYLPEEDTYIEVKNFWWKYSIERDRKFRRAYPHIKLRVVLKEEYLTLEKKYASSIPNWEYRNSKV